MIDFSDKTQLTCFVAASAAILCLLAMAIVFWARMKKRLPGWAFAVWLTATIIILVAGIAACLTTIAYKTEFLKIDSEVVGNALAFEYDGKIVFSIPGLGIFFDVVFNYALVEMLVYVLTLVDLALLVLVCVRRNVTRALYSGNADGEGYYTVSEHEDEPGAFAVCDESDGTELAANETTIDETPAIGSPAEEQCTDAGKTVGEETTAAEENIAAHEENREEERVSLADDMPAPLEEYVEDEEPATVEPVADKKESEEPVEPAAEESEQPVEEENQPVETTEEPAPEEKEEPIEPVETTETTVSEEPAVIAEEPVAPESAEETTVPEEPIAEETASEIPTQVEPVNVTESGEAGTETESQESAKPAEPEEKTPDRAARFMAPVVASDKTRRTAETPIAARKNGRVTVKSRAAEMFGEYLGGRSAADREKLLDSIDVITKKND